MNAAQTKLQQQVLVVNELMRHFWASVPCLSTMREQKAKRMTAELLARQDAIKEILTGLDPQIAVKLSTSVQPAFQAVQAAQARFLTEQSKRAAMHHVQLMSH